MQTKHEPGWILGVLMYLCTVHCYRQFKIQFQAEVLGKQNG